MANPSSSQRERDENREERGRDRVVRERSHHHHRTISSTTLLLILSLVLAVLAVMLSLPSARGVGSSSTGATPLENEPSGAGLWGMFTPRRSQNIVVRESAVAKREAEVARREADILAGALVTCGPYATVTETYETIAAPPPVQTIYKEIVKEDSLSAPGAAELTRRVEELLTRESKVADREKDMSRREESVNRREHDAQRRETWIMEQLIALGNDPQMIEEEYIYEPSGAKRKFKSLPISSPPPPAYPSSPPPAGTRFADFPEPQSLSSTLEPASAPTKVVELFLDNDDLDGGQEVHIGEDGIRTVTVLRSVKPTKRPRRWLW